MSETAPYSPAPDVAGTKLDGTAVYSVSADANERLCRSVGVEPANDGTAHPVWYYVSTQVAMGETVAGLCEICEFNIADGPLMGSSTVRFVSPIMVGSDYRVSGEILSLVRKQSRKLGVMDLLTYRLRLHPAEGGAAILETDNVWALPRKEFK
jgi:hypothetical protein